MELGIENEAKRMRTSSGNSTLTSQHVTSNLHRYGERILHCNVNITLGIRETGNTAVLRYVCALLNSGGGILHMKNLDAEHCVVLSKHLDTWWSGMEIKMAEILSRDDICNYFDLVGNHDDLDLYLFVKTAEHLCTLHYHCRLPTDTATHDVTYQSLMRLLVNKGEPGTLEQLPIIPQQYVYGQSAEELKKETKQIQFKQLASSENKSKQVNRLPEKVCEMMIKYVSAFANHEGGHIYFGIGDTRASVMGEEINQAEQRNLEMLVARRMQTMIWSETSRETVRGIHWDIKFFHVENTPKKCRRVVVVVSVCKFPGGVFTSCPVSSFVNAANNCVMNFTFEDWKEAILNPLRDVPELHHRFLKLSLMVPLAPLVFTLPDTITTIKQKVILAKSDDLQPRQYLEGYTNSKQRDIVRSILSNFNFKRNNSVCLGMECWGLKIPMNICDDILCDVAIITELDGIHVLTFSTSYQEQVVLHSQTAALVLKNKLVQHGGCSEKFSILSHVVNIDQTDIIFRLEKEIKSRSMYPTPFNSNKAKFDKVIQACIVTMAAYRTKSQAVMTLNQNGSYYFLLTHDQFELLWTQQFTKELWVHGPSGAGKTVTAIQLIQELRRRGCCHDNILYLAENNQLCKFVESHKLCLVTTRRQLLSDVTNPNLMTNQYGRVCNVIIDEVQNFKDRDGDWYSVAEKLANQNPPNQLYRCSNYFWLFMDYTQKVHKFQAGLPSVIGKNNFMLSEVSRSTKEIFDFTSRLMMASENIDGIGSPVLQNVHTVPILAHNFSSGQGVDILSCTEVEIKNVLNKVLTGLLQNGVHENDIAILVGKRSELDRLKPTLSDIHVNESSRAKTDTTEYLGITARSVEEHLSNCDSDKPVQKTVDTVGVHSDSDVSLFEDISDDGSDDLESLETGNRYNVLSPDSSEENIAARDDGKVSMETVDSISNKTDVKLYSHESVVEDTDLPDDHINLKQAAANDDVSMDLDTGLAIDTVKGFSGLDKIAIIGLNPLVNEEHADFKKYIMSLATRAKDNLVIITTSENIKKQLEDFVHNSS